MDDIRLSEPVSETGTGRVGRRTAHGLRRRQHRASRTSGRMASSARSTRIRPIGPATCSRSAGNLRLDRFLPTSFGLAIPLTSPTPARHQPRAAEPARPPGRRAVRAPEAGVVERDLLPRRSGGAGPGTDLDHAAVFVDPLVDHGEPHPGTKSDRAVATPRPARTPSTRPTCSRCGGRVFRLPFGGIGGVCPSGCAKVSGEEPFAGRLQPGAVPDQTEQRTHPRRIELDGLPGAGRAQRRRALPADAGAHPPLAQLGRAHLAAVRHAEPERRSRPDAGPPGVSRLDDARPPRVRERRFLLGIPVGVERDRNARDGARPHAGLSSWLRPRFLSSGTFLLSRTLSSRDPVRADGDSGAFILPQTLNNIRANELGASFDFARGIRLLDGRQQRHREDGSARCGRVDMSTRLTRTSTFDLTAFDSEPEATARAGRPRPVPGAGGDAGRRQRRNREWRPLPAGPICRSAVAVTLSHALTRTTRFQRVSGGFIQTETKHARVAGGERPLDPHLPRGRASRCSRSAPPSAIGRGARCRRTGGRRRR